MHPLASTNTCLSSPEYTLCKSSETMLRAELQEEEFQEADILWPDELPRAYFSHIGLGDDEDSGEYSGEHQPPLKLQAPHQKAASSPIDIPGRKVVGARGPQVPGRYSRFGASHAGVVGAGSVVIGSHVFVPPHVIDSSSTGGPRGTRR
ncbi:hypothetical protein C2845_PM07G21820 [Panicum miliaceum]|uniref:Uncharacterized protein n=1 Tax=Panicum miliaceum TaxID=4540 RepID=A0A3L6SH66_PANMI|nr:hypothetical protein C2845_PM07G21820 [Panicum miliaceum]